MAVKRHRTHYDVTAENRTDAAMNAVERNMNKVERAASSMGRTFRNVLSATAAIALGREIGRAAIEAEQASKRLDAVLKATGHTAGLTKEQLDGMADAMALSTQFDDETLRNAQAQMLKFGNIQEEVFTRAMGLAADYAALMGTDLNAAVQQVGRALAAPAAGLTFLERNIGKYTEAQREAIRAAEEAGDLWAAQQIILDGLTSKIGGTAEALNSGLFKAANDVTKAWDEMLESIGRTEAVQATASSALGFVEQSLKDIKEIVDKGDWIEKTLAILAFAGGFRGFKLSAQPGGAPPAGGTSQTDAAAAAAAARQQAEEEALLAQVAKDTVMVDAAIKKWREEAKRLRAERIREDERNAQAIVAVEEMAAQDTAEAWGFVLEQEQGRQEKRLEDARRASASWVESAQIAVEAAESVVFTWDAAGNRIEIARDHWDELADEAKKVDDAARSLGLTFTSAFEDAVLGGKKLSEVIRGLGQDIARVILRKSITEPLGGAISKSVVGLFKAEGGPVSAGEPYIVGERGPELFVPRGAGNIVPQGGPAELRFSAGGGGRSGPVYNFDMRGASLEAVARVERLLMQLNGSIEGRALGVLRSARARGMA
jgi:hypothetical protein